LIMTNDGDLAYRMTHPKFEVDKTYFVICGGRLSNDELNALRRGVMLDDGVNAPAVVKNVRILSNGNMSFELTIHEGRNRQVRRMVEAVGHKTLLLRRISIGAVGLGSLRPGEWRVLSAGEMGELRVRSEE